MTPLLTIKHECWDAAGKDLAKVNKARLGIQLDPETPEYWDAVLRNLEPAKRRRRKPTAIPLSQAAKDRYRAAKLQYDTQKYPNWIKGDSLGTYFLEPDYPDANTKKGIDEFIINFLKWNGHFENPTNNKGFPIDKTAPKMNIHSGKVEQVVTGEKEWRNSGANKGMQDIDCTLRHVDHPYGIPWKIETKTANDYQSKDQIKFEAKVKGTAGVYSVVWGIDHFLSLYDSLMVRKNVLF